MDDDHNHRRVRAMTGPDGALNFDLSLASRYLALMANSHGRCQASTTADTNCGSLAFVPSSPMATVLAGAR
jgi:hypothetical protein